MIQSGGILSEKIAGTSQLMYLTGKQVLKRYIISKRYSTKLAEKTTDYYVNKGK